MARCRVRMSRAASRVSRQPVTWSSTSSPASRCPARGRGCSRPPGGARTRRRGPRPPGATAAVLVVRRTSRRLASDPSLPGARRGAVRHRPGRLRPGLRRYLHRRHLPAPRSRGGPPPARRSELRPSSAAAATGETSSVPLVPPLTDLPVEGCIAEVRGALSGAGPRRAARAARARARRRSSRCACSTSRGSDGGRIVVLEPRRLAARAAAHRMADPARRGRRRARSATGPATSARSAATTRIEVVTEGILTRRLQHDPSLPGVGLVVVRRDPRAQPAGRPRTGPHPRRPLGAATRAPGAGHVGHPRHRPGRRAPRRGRRRRHRSSPARVGRYPVEIRWRPPDPRDRPAEAAAAAVLAGAAGATRATCSCSSPAPPTSAGSRRSSERCGARPRRRPPAVRRALAGRAGPGAGAVATRPAPGRARHRHRRDQPHRGRRAHRGRQRPGAQPPLRRPQRADPPAHRADLPGVGRPASGPGRAHRPRASPTGSGPRASTPTGGRSPRPRSRRSTWPASRSSSPCGARRPPTSRSSTRRRTGRSPMPTTCSSSSVPSTPTTT